MNLLNDRRSTETHNKRVILVLFGLDRSTRWTWDSIECNLLAPCRIAFREFRAIARFNFVEQLSNKRSRERDITLMRGQARDRYSTFEHFFEDLQAPRLDPYYEEVLPTLSDFYKDNFRSYRNVVRALENQNRILADLTALGYRHHDLFIIARPDLYYLDPLPINDLVKAITVDGLDLLTPEWDSYGGINDRLAVASSRGADVYLGRQRRLREYLEKCRSLHSESFLRYAVNRDRLKTGHLDLRAVRVRGNGQVDLRDQRWLEQPLPFEPKQTVMTPETGRRAPTS